MAESSTITVTPTEWGGACDPCRITWIWPREPKQNRTADLKAARCPRCGASELRPAHGQAAYETIRAPRHEMHVDQPRYTSHSCPNAATHRQTRGKEVG